MDSDSILALCRMATRELQECENLQFLYENWQYDFKEAISKIIIKLELVKIIMDIVINYNIDDNITKLHKKLKKTTQRKIDAYKVVFYSID